MKTPKVQAVQPQEDFTVLLTFENGERRLFDMKPYLEAPVFRALQDARLFQQVRIVSGSLEWPGERDLGYDMLYAISEPVAQETA